MATLSEWVAGARPRTLPAAITPVAVGVGISLRYLRDWTATTMALALLALVVAVALQIGVNYANDYSDGIRGTDANRVGPQRLVGSGAAAPRHVKMAALVSFGVAGLAGLVAVAISQQWWLLVLGAASILAAWFYTGGKRPYGYRGWGELFVFVFFGLAAVLGTIGVLGVLPQAWPAGLVGAVSVGAIACSILVANNLRDINGDQAAGKRTLATRLGDRRTRWLFLACLGVSLLGVIILGWMISPWLWLGLASALVMAPAVRIVRSGAVGPELIVVLKWSGQAELVLGIGILVGAVLAVL